MKIKNTKESKRNEFRKNKKTGHPAYIYAKVGKEFKFIGITHSKITNGIENIKLDKNPNSEDKKTAYAKPQAEKEKIHRFKYKYNNWKLSKSDRNKLDKFMK